MLMRDRLGRPLEPPGDALHCRMCTPGQDLSEYDHQRGEPDIDIGVDLLGLPAAACCDPECRERGRGRTCLGAILRRSDAASGRLGMFQRCRPGPGLAEPLRQAGERFLGHPTALDLLADHALSSRQFRLIIGAHPRPGGEHLELLDADQLSLIAAASCLAAASSARAVCSSTFADW